MKHRTGATTDEELEQLRTRIKQTRRAALNVEALQVALPPAYACLRERGSTPAARDREARFVASSPSYAATVDAPLAPQVHVGALGPLTWHTPLLSDQPERVADILSQQHFPFRMMTQTRQGGLGGFMLDIGANNGRMSIPRVILGDVTAAYCAEPDPLNYACLVANASRNGLGGLVLADQVAISDRDGVGHLHRANKPGGHTLMEASDRTIPIPIATLDTWMNRHGIQACEVSFVKLDVQGSEAAILRGAAGLRSRRHVYWQIEIDYNQMRVHDVNPRELFALLAQTGSHFTDLNRHVTTPRIQPIEEVAESTAYLHEAGGHTDILLFSLTH